MHKFRHPIIILIAIFTLLASSGFSNDQAQLRVTDNHRYLEYTDGTPFFYLGDTAWELFQRLNRDEADRYLTNRKEKGFTVIQAVVISQTSNCTTPNAYGDVALVDKDPTQPNEAYFKHVDSIVNKAEELGLFIGMLPTWGSYWTGNNPIFTPESARSFGRYLANRYQDKPIIWILGGDENIRNKNQHDIIDSLASGLREIHDGSQLMTFHPRGPGLSSPQLHSEEWLDFNMFQSSHAAHDHDTGIYVEHDLALKPLKPTLDGEPHYECINAGFYFKDWNRYDRFDDFDVRQSAYWSLMAGACGYTYGNNNIWQMWAPGRGSIIQADIPWYEALDHPGAFQMKFVRQLFESRPFHKLRPSSSFIVDGPSYGAAKVRSIIAEDGSFAFVYSPLGEKFTVNTLMIKANRIKAIWYNPKYGNSYHIHSSDTHGFQTYTPPTSGRGNDWILILEDADKGYPLPGK
jgi:hypothetical protein